jgi:hypothetical protein
MAAGHAYGLDRQENGWWPIRSPDLPEALTEAEMELQAGSATLNCAARLCMTEASFNRLLDLRHHPAIRTIDRTLDAMSAELPVSLPDFADRRRASMAPEMNSASRDCTACGGKRIPI